jgi:hypothetical protein
LTLSHAAWAADPEVDAIRRELKELRESYEARIQALEKRLQEAESKPVAAPSPQASAPNAFNPAISVILNGTYANLSRDTPDHKKGFSLGESEITLTANVDDKFSGNLIVSLTPENTVSVEEAYAIYTAAPAGLVPKFGRFFSGIGYLNEQHAHAWDFVDAPLPYQSFLGGQYSQDGIQLKWLAPTEHFIELGAEAGNGSSFPGEERNKNGVGSAAAYIHTGGDIGESHSWRAGLSYLRPGVSDSNLAIADFTWKWSPNGNGRETNFKLQGEYFEGTEGARQSGWYLQGVYQPFPLWRFGARYDRLDAGNLDSFAPKRASAMVDWSPSEFSRLRLQFTRAKTLADAVDNQWFVQYILTLGAHGAHRY